MLPCQTANNLKDRKTRDGVPASKLANGNAFLVEAANVANILISELRAAVDRAEMAAKDHSPFGHRIAHVLFLGSGKQMGGIAASRIIAVRAVVAGIQPIGDRVVCKLKSYAAGHKRAAFPISPDEELTIVRGGARRLPIPTSIGAAGAVNFRPEPFDFFRGKINAHFDLQRRVPRRGRSNVARLLVALILPQILPIYGKEATV